MITVKLGMLAEQVLQDSLQNSLSIIGLIDHIFAQSFPVFIPRLTVIWILERDVATDPSQPPAQMAFMMGEEELNHFDVAINFAEQPTTRAIVTFGGYVIPHPGTLTVTLSSEGNRLGAFDVTVAQGLQPPRPPQMQ